MSNIVPFIKKEPQIQVYECPCGSHAFEITRCKGTYAICCVECAYVQNTAFKIVAAHLELVGSK